MSDVAIEDRSNHSELTASEWIGALRIPRVFDVFVTPASRCGKPSAPFAYLYASPAGGDGEFEARSGSTAPSRPAPISWNTRSHHGR